VSSRGSWRDTVKRLAPWRHNGARNIFGKPIEQLNAAEQRTAILRDQLKAILAEALLR
jgi:hypothetical protein